MDFPALNSETSICFIYRTKLNSCIIIRMAVKMICFMFCWWSMHLNRIAFFFNVGLIHF